GAEPGAPGPLTALAVVQVLRPRSVAGEVVRLARAVARRARLRRQAPHLVVAARLRAAPRAVVRARTAAARAAAVVAVHRWASAEVVISTPRLAR
ncbi:hypothetical protein, partial [Mycobacterium kiyosense]